MRNPQPTKLRPAEGWPKDWYYSGEFDTVNLEALLAPDKYFNRVILGRTPICPQGCSEGQPQPSQAEDAAYPAHSGPPQESTGS